MKPLNPKIRAAFNAVEATLQVTEEQLKGPVQKANLVLGRKIFVVLLVEHGGMTYSEAGKCVSRDHSTAIYHVKAHPNDLRTYNEYQVSYRQALQHYQMVMMKKYNNIYEELLETFGEEVPNKETVIITGRQFTQAIKFMKNMMDETSVMQNFDYEKDEKSHPGRAEDIQLP